MLNNYVNLAKAAGFKLGKNESFTMFLVWLARNTQTNIDDIREIELEYGCLPAYTALDVLKTLRG